MNKILLFIYITILTGYTYSQQWQKVVSGSLPDLNSIYFTNENTGFIVGLFGSILKSTNGGKSWEIKQSGTKKHLNSIYYSNNLGVIAGDDRTILYTLDNGENWRLDSLTVVPDSTADIKKIYFEDDKNGWTIVSTSKKSWVLRTNSGGEYWTIDTTIMAELHEITFYNGKGIITGKKVSDIYYTDDGVSWINCGLPLNWDGSLYPIKSDVRAIFINDDLVYAVGYGNANTPTIYLKSTDGGVSWEYISQNFENITFDNLYGVYFKDSLNGIAVGGNNTSGILVTQTSDGGLNWQKKLVPFGGYAKSLFGSRDKLWLCGSGGLIACSEDFGNTWYLNTIPNAPIFSAIEFPSSNTGFSGGKFGTLFNTIDGGKNWNTSYLYNGTTISEIKDLHFLNEMIGYSAHEDGIVSKTTDGGLIWNVIMHRENASISSIYFLNENFGFVTALQNKTQEIIFKTTDSGSHWEQKDSLLGKGLKCIRFYDENHGVVVGAEKKILYTADGGETWSIPININDTISKPPSLNSVAFANKDLLYAVGTSALYRSTDGGANWDYVDLPEKKTWNSIKFQDSTLGYMVGANYIMKTTDSGYSWNNISDSVITGTLYDIDIDDDGFVWVCGNNSSIYTNKDITSSIAVNELPLEFQIAQNYPNPFNPSTTIVYSIPLQGMVELKVFDMLGQEVKTLVNDIQQGGTHRVSFNAGNLSSGIYFYTIKYNNLLQSRKMTLIK